MKKAGFTRSMSKKGCTPDNAACEGFFGRLKNEMFYYRDWSGTTIEEFIDELDRNRSTNPGSMIRSPAVQFPPEEQQHDNVRTDRLLD